MRRPAELLTNPTMTLCWLDLSTAHTVDQKCLVLCTMIGIS